jgi:hypothetical protein
MTEQAKAPEKLSDEQQWQLALAYLRRAEIAAHVLRVVLFFTAIAVTGLILVQMQPNDRGPGFIANVASVALALIAVLCLVKSWQLQKEKAVERFKYFKAKDADAVALYDGVSGQLRGLQSRFWDWLAFCALIGAILAQFAVRTIGAAGPLPV